MKDEEIMFILEAIAYVSATLAAFVYIWDTCFITKVKYVRKRNASSDSNIKPEQNTRLSSSGNSIFDDF